MTIQKHNQQQEVRSLERMEIRTTFTKNENKCCHDVVIDAVFRETYSLSNLYHPYMRRK